MKIYLEKKLIWLALLSFSSLIATSEYPLSQADSTSLKTIGITSAVDGLVLLGCFTTEAASTSSKLQEISPVLAIKAAAALVRSGCLAGLCYGAASHQKSLPLRVRDWLTISGCITKNALRLSAPFMKNTSHQMAAYSSVALLELGTLAHAGYYFLDNKKINNKKVIDLILLACLTSIGCETFIQGKALQKASRTLPLTPATKDKEKEQPSEVIPPYIDPPVNSNPIPQPISHHNETSLFDETDTSILATCSKKDFIEAFQRDMKKAPELNSLDIDMSAFKDDTNCYLCSGEKHDEWVFNLSPNGKTIASFCHVGCLGHCFVENLKTSRRELPQQDLSVEEALDRKMEINQNFMAQYRRHPTPAEFGKIMRDVYESEEVLPQLPFDPTTRKPFHKVWKEFYVTETA